jgi:hypothetical protein
MKITKKNYEKFCEDNFCENDIMSLLKTICGKWKEFNAELEDKGKGKGELILRFNVDEV